MLNIRHKLTTLVLSQADAAVQADFLKEMAALEAHVKRGEVVLYYADATHPTHNARYIRA